MKLIETVTVGAGGSSTISLNSIPADFTDLLIITSLRGISYAGITLNGNNSNTSMRVLWGTGSNAQNANYTSFTYNIWQTLSKNGNTANTFGSSQIHIPNYRSSVAKSISIDSVGETNATGAEQIISGALWNNTAAITSISFTSLDDNLNPSGVFAQHSSVSLYGITKGSDGVTTVS